MSLTLKSAVISFFFIVFTFTFNALAQTDWYQEESEHFKLIYRGSHQHLVEHILLSAEASYKSLTKIFNYSTSEKIIINTYDINDYGFGAATTVPENFIRLEIEPFEPGYENTPYDERFQWILNHELVHIFVNDGASNAEKLSRRLFRRVAPEQIQPLTILYSIAGNYNRYTPRWHQEAPAVFLETWLSGGFGRVLGSFDEMYFRSLVADQERFPGSEELETITTHNSFLLETLFYLYGGRFGAYLAYSYGSDKLIEWFKSEPENFYSGFKQRFNKVFYKDFDNEWNQFVKFETEFQKKSLSSIRSAGVTRLEYLSDQSLGWVTQPYVDSRSSRILFGSHRSHYLAGIYAMYRTDKKVTELSTIPSPSIYQVASTAFDSSSGNFFYTTNNNQLYRDLWVYNINTGETELLFPDSRVGQLTVSPSTREIWGIQHWGGRAAMVYSVAPYEKLYTIYHFQVGEEVFNLSVSPSGQNLAAVIHLSSGEQKLVLVNISELKRKQEFTYKVVTDKGQPENPSWSNDEKIVLWNAYINGVSNIYSYDVDREEVSPLTNTTKGLFKPVYMTNDSIFAFEFSVNGFYPVKFSIEKPSYLPAIRYFGQLILEKETHLEDMIVERENGAGLKESFINEQYTSFSEIKPLTLIPVITGFQKQKAFGIFSHFSDPLINHDIITEIAYSPFGENKAGPKFHLKFKYDYAKKYELGIEHNAPDFYDLVNRRKRGMIGTKVRFGYIHYWLYDNPHKIVQKTEVAAYTGVKYINDNLVSVSEPDFLVAQTSWNSKNLRRTIGSSDYEHGEEYNAVFMLFASDPYNPEYAAEIYAEWSLFRIWMFRHNVFHYKIAAGYHVKNDNLRQARFYFGGFGNRLLENVDAKQFRSVFRFPGIPIYSLSSDKFLKILLENNFPPLRFSNIGLGNQLLNHIDFSVFSQTLVAKTYDDDFYFDIGAQFNLILKNWYNLETTLSVGAAQAWSKNISSFDWFFSIKLLKN